MRYLGFYGDNHYPEGGLNDLVVSATTLEGALNEIFSREAVDKWFHVYDVQNQEIVARSHDQEIDPLPRSEDCKVYSLKEGVWTL